MEWTELVCSLCIPTQKLRAYAAASRSQVQKGKKIWVAFQAANRKPVKLLGRRHCGCKKFPWVQGVDGTNTGSYYIETPQVASETQS